MTEEQDPPRLADDPRHAASIAALRRDRPSAAADARVLAALRGGGPGGGGGGGLGRVPVGRLLVGVAALAVAVGLVATVTQRRAAPSWAQHAPVALASPDAPSVVHPAAPASATAPKPVAAAARPPEPIVARRAPEEPRATDEVELIVEARRSVATVPSAAARLLDRHARLFPSGVLEPEREALRAELAIRRGPRASGEQALARFERAHPGSAHAERLRRLLEAPR